MTIGALLIVIAFLLAKEVKELLIGQGVEKHISEKMRKFLQDRPEVEQLYNLLTMQMGHEAMVAVKVKMRSTGSEQGLLEAINCVERDFRLAFPVAKWLFFEPDNVDK